MQNPLIGFQANEASQLWFVLVQAELLEARRIVKHTPIKDENRILLEQQGYNFHVAEDGQTSITKQHPLVEGIQISTLNLGALNLGETSWRIGEYSIVF
jgi:hypothetical protein